jgi:alpha-D-xyloside xylohydrolase
MKINRKKVFAVLFTAVCFCDVVGQNGVAGKPSAGGIGFCAPAVPAGWVKPAVTEISRGVWRVRFGVPERFTPDALRERPADLAGLSRLPAPSPLPFKPEEIACRVTDSRTVVYVPCDEPGGQIYGFGLDPVAYEQKGLRKFLTVCAGVMGKTGASHGPVPFWLSTRGYGVYVDTARVPLVHVARLSPKDSGASASEQGEVKTSVDALYAARKATGKTAVVVEIPGDTQGVDVYVFAGSNMREAVQRYNLFSGGGCLPPLWGLGMRLRTYAQADQAAVMKVAKALREMRIPCDGLGLEPGWQSAAYSCSLVWSDRFPKHEEMSAELGRMGFRLNLWEHAYIHPSSPLYAPLKNRSGDSLVWGGLTVDFADPAASKIFSDYHGKTFVDQGISGFKADECDNQPITDCTPFNFPYSSIFPSGIDGEQMSQLYGYLYQRSILAAYKERNLRTWGEVRATASLAAPLPFALYSDAYQFDQYLRQLVNASFAGLLWSPEVREAGTYDELLNRVALSSFAPQMTLNLWMLPHPLWEQYRLGDNQAHRLLPPEEQARVAARLRDIVSLRYRLLPYLYAAFHRYRTEGLPPVRSLLLDFPDDPALRSIDDQFMFGDNLLAAPFLGDKGRRVVCLPKGCNWIELKTGTLFAGGQTRTVRGEPGDMPLFVRENTLLPWAEPLQSVGKDTQFDLTVRVFGDHPAPFVLAEDDGETTAFESGAQNLLTLTWKDGTGTVKKQGNFPGSRYRLTRWEKVATRAAVSVTENSEGGPASFTNMMLVSFDAAFTVSSRLETDPGSGRLLDAQDGDDAFAFHTAHESGAHVVIDLKQRREIAGLSILNRCDGTPEVFNRAASLAVWLSDDGLQWSLLWEAGAAKPAWDLLFAKPQSARYLKLGLQEPDFLHLKRVRVYARK